MRVNVQLINAQTDSHLWADTYDRKLTDILGVESEIAKGIAESLQAKLSPTYSQALASAQTRNAEAYDLFLRGEYEFHQAESRETAGAYDRADGFTDRPWHAIQILPRPLRSSHVVGYPALGGLSFGASEIRGGEAIIDRALALAPNSPERALGAGVILLLGPSPIRHGADRSSTVRWSYNLTMLWRGKYRAWCLSPPR